jgi:hypothetical protein
MKELYALRAGEHVRAGLSKRQSANVSFYGEGEPAMK